jgi:Family of unknown function (DUF6328)
MALERKLKTALDETRLLILGAQVLFGFQFNGAFQELFAQLTPGARALQFVALLMIMTTVGLLIAPSMRHRIAEAGRVSGEVLAATTLFAGLALLPLAVGLGLDIFVLLGRIYATAVGAVAGGAFFLLAALCWFGIPFVSRRNEIVKQPEPAKAPSLSTQVEQLLTEARVIIPGARHHRRRGRVPLSKRKDSTYRSGRSPDWLSRTWRLDSAPVASPTVSPGCVTEPGQRT